MKYITILLLCCMIIGIASANVVIFPTQTAKLNSTGAAGNVFQITYTWYNECPTCSSYTAFPTSNSIVYYWVTNSATQLGGWQVFLSANDGTGNIVNSLPVNVLLITNKSSSGGGNVPPSLTIAVSNNNIAYAAIALAVIAGGLAAGAYAYKGNKEKINNEAKT